MEFFLMFLTVFIVLPFACAVGIVARGNEHLYGVTIEPKFYTKEEARRKYRLQGCSQKDIERYLKAWDQA
jgi:hypothetical protein